MVFGPFQEGDQVGFVDGADGVEVCAAAVVLRQVAAKLLRQVSGVEDEEGAETPKSEEQELGEEI